MHIGLDVGYGYTKAVNDEGKRVLFPSIVAKSFERTIEAFSNSKDGDIVKNLYVKIAADNGTAGYYFVGELAKRESPFGTFNLEAHRVEIDETKILMAVAAALLMNNSEEEFNVVTGLPLKQYKIQKEEFLNKIKNFRAVVEFPDYDTVKVVKFTKVNIFPQAAGAVYHALMSDDTYEQLIKNTYVVLIDIGFKTADFAVFYYDGRMNFIPELSNTVDIGMSRVLTVLDKLYTQKTGSNADIETLMSIIHDSRVFYRGKFIDFSKELNELKEETFKAIVKTVLSTLGDKYERISTVFVAGGGAVDLFTQLKGTHYQLKVIPDPQFANAKGFLKVAQKM